MRSAKTRADEIYEQGLFQATDSSVVLSAFGQIWSSGANAREAGLGKCKPVRHPGPSRKLFRGLRPKAGNAGSRGDLSHRYMDRDKQIDRQTHK